MVSLVILSVVLYLTIPFAVLCRYNAAPHVTHHTVPHYRLLPYVPQFFHVRVLIRRKWHPATVVVTKTTTQMQK